MIEVRPAATRADLGAFAEFPYRHYRGHSFWVPPLRISERRRFNRRTNPFFEHADVEFFLAREAGVVRGRIAAIDDRRHNEVHGDNLASFGLFEADADAVAVALLDEAGAWARARGRTAMRGPLSFSLNETAGLLVDGFDTPPAILMPWNPPEYATYLTDAGFDKVKDLFAWTLDLDKPLDPSLVELAERVRQRYRVEIESPTATGLMAVIPGFLDIYAKAWAGNWGFVAPTEAESRRFANDLKWIADPDFVLSVKVDGVKAACAVAVPDVNQALIGTDGRLSPRTLLRLLFRRRHIDQARLLLLGVLPEYRKLGLFPLLLAELSRRSAGGRFRTAEFSWVLEDNADINRVAARVGARCVKTYRLFQKDLR